MIEQELELTSLEITPASDVELNPARCYIVPVASVEADDSGVLHRIWELASQTGAKVQLVGLCEEKTGEPAMRRALVMMAALMRSGGLTVQVNIITGRNWTRQLQSSLGPNDTVICRLDPSERFLGHSLSWQLQSRLNASFLLLSGAEPLQSEQLKWLAEAAGWIGTAAILAAFFLLQVRIDQIGGGLAAFLESLSVVAEVVLVCAWIAWSSGSRI